MYLKFQGDARMKLYRVIGKAERHGTILVLDRTGTLVAHHSAIRPKEPGDLLHFEKRTKEGRIQTDISRFHYKAEEIISYDERWVVPKDVIWRKIQS